MLMNYESNNMRLKEDATQLAKLTTGVPQRDTYAERTAGVLSWSGKPRLCKIADDCLYSDMSA